MIRAATRLAVVSAVITMAAASPTARGEQRSYENYRLLRVDVTDPDQIDEIEAAGGIVLNCIHGPGPMDVVADESQTASIRQLGARVEVLHENFQDLVTRSKAQGLRTDPFDDFFLDYHPYGDANSNGTIVWYMNELVTRYPSLVSMINIGATLEGRTIWGMRIANDAVPGDKPAVFYYSCQHAREWVTTTVPNYFANYILERYGSDITLTDMIDHMEIFLVPVANVDGYIYTWTDDRLWRKNRRPNINGSFGVDINRNWGENWGYDDDGSSPNPSSATYRGTGPFSEPETQALRDFFYAHPNIRAKNDIHSYSQLILWPYGYADILPENQDVYLEIGQGMHDEILAVHGEEYVYGPVNTTIYAVNGGSVDWAHAQLGVLAFSYELRPDEGIFGSGFELDPAEIIPNNEEIVPALLRMTNSDWVRSPVIVSLPAGAPEILTPGQTVAIPVTIESQYENLVPGSGTLHYRYDATGPYLEAPLAQVSSNGYEAILPATNCTSTPEFYFSAMGDGGSAVTNPRPGVLAPYTAPVAIYSDDFSVDPGWNTTGLWAWGAPAGGGSFFHDPTSGYTGANVYGYNLAGDYEINLPATYLTTPPIDCTGRYGLHMQFRRWLGVESSFEFDEATVEVSNNGVDWTVLWRATDTGGNVSDDSWQLQVFDISAVADDQATVQIRWGMGPSDDSVTYPGWNIDDFLIYGTGCDPLLGDHNGDELVNLGDFAAFPSCVQGPNGGLGPGCVVFDFDGDSDIDLIDFAGFQGAFD